MTDSVLWIILSIVIGIAAGGLEAWMLCSIVNAVTDGKDMPVGKLIIFVFLPLISLLPVAFFIKPFYVLYTGTASVVIIVGTALYKFINRQQKNKKEK